MSVKSKSASRKKKTRGSKKNGAAKGKSRSSATTRKGSSAKSVSSKGVQLSLKRSQRKSPLGFVIFMLDAQLKMSEAQRERIQKYKIGKSLIYESAARRKYLNNTLAHLGQSHDSTSMFAPAGEQARGIGKSLYRLTRAGMSSAAAAMSQKVTVDSVIKGVRIESKNLNEILDAESAIRMTAEDVKAYLRTASAFNQR